MDRDELLNDSENAHRYALENLQTRLWTTFPAIVTAVNLTAMTLECVPAIKGTVTAPDGSTSFVTLPKLVDCPISFPSAGGFTLTLPVKVNDEVMVHIASRCIDAWWQSGGIQPPMEARMHDLSDGFAVPGLHSQPRVLTGISANNAQLRSDDGTVYLEITPGGQINLKAPSGVAVTGNLTVTGTITGTTDVVAAGKSLKAHIHPVSVPATPFTGDTTANL